MAWKPKYFIVFPYAMVEQISWSKEWGAQCAVNLLSVLKEVLNVSTIGSEIKLIWNEWHREVMLEKNGITQEQLDGYLKADCSMLSFQAKGTMQRAAKALTSMGGTNFVCVDSYKDVILQQVFYERNKKFNL